MHSLCSDEEEGSETICILDLISRECTEGVIKSWRQGSRRGKLLAKNTNIDNPGGIQAAQRRYEGNMVEAGNIDRNKAKSGKMKWRTRIIFVVIIMRSISLVDGPASGALKSRKRC